MALVFRDTGKTYFAKPLALKNLFGDQAFSDLKKLLDPCCGIGIDNICIAPCGGSGPTTCPTLVINSVNINCTTGECSMSVTLSGFTGTTFTGSLQVQGTVHTGGGPLPIAAIADIFTLTGNGTFTVPLPVLCSLYQFLLESAFETITGILAYSEGGIASNLLTPSSGSFHSNCPYMVPCSPSISKKCPDSYCDENGIPTFSVTLKANGTTGPYMLQVSIDGGTTWMDYAPIAIIADGTSYLYTVDISTLGALIAPATYFDWQVVDSLGTINSSYGGSLPVPTCNVITISKSDSECRGIDQQIHLEFTYSLNEAYNVEIDFGSGYVVVAYLGPLTGGSYLDTFGPIGTPYMPGTYPIRVVSESGDISNLSSITFVNCAA